MQLKQSIKANTVEDLNIVTINGQHYYVKGDLGELQSAFLNAQGMFSNIYPYQDPLLINDVTVFDQSVVSDLIDHGRDSIQAIGFSEIIPYAEEEETQYVGEPVETDGTDENTEVPSGPIVTDGVEVDDVEDPIKNGNTVYGFTATEEEPKELTEIEKESKIKKLTEIEKEEPFASENENIVDKVQNEDIDTTLEEIKNMSKSQLLEAISLRDDVATYQNLNKATLQFKLLELTNN